MNYLITGGTGLIGQALITELRHENAHITVLTRNIDKAKTILPSSVHFIDELSLCVIENSDIVINLAGEPIANKRWSATQKQTICESRWSITHALVSFIKQTKTPPRLLISGSAIGIYGRQHDQKITEDFTDFHDEFTHRVCSKWEKIALNAKTANTRVALLRTGIVLAKNNGALQKMLLPFKLGLGGKISQGKQMMSWIHSQDMVNAILHIIAHKDLSGPINMTATHAVTNEQFTCALAAALHRPCFFTTPAPLLTLMLGEMADLLLYGQNIYPQKLQESGFNFQYHHIDSALADLVRK